MQKKYEISNKHPQRKMKTGERDPRRGVFCKENTLPSRHMKLAGNNNSIYHVIITCQTDRHCFLLFVPFTWSFAVQKYWKSLMSCRYQNSELWSHLKLFPQWLWVRGGRPGRCSVTFHRGAWWVWRWLNFSYCYRSQPELHIVLEPSWWLVPRDLGEEGALTAWERRFFAIWCVTSTLFLTASVCIWSIFFIMWIRELRHREVKEPEFTRLGGDRTGTRAPAAYTKSSWP